MYVCISQTDMLHSLYHLQWQDRLF